MEIKKLQIELSMSDGQITKWLTEHNIGNDEPQATLQIRVTATGGLDLAHIQGFGNRGSHGNRPYGFADKFYVESNLVSWLGEREPTDMSFASEQRCYIRGCCLIEYDDGVTLQIENENAGNVASGYLLALNKDSMKVKALLAWARENDLVTPVGSGVKMPRVPKEE